MPVFIVHDPDSRHITGNRAADELLRNPRGAEASLSAPAETKPCHFRALKGGRELTTDEMPAQQAARGIHVWDYEFSLAFDDGTVRDVLGYGTPLLDEARHPRGGILVLVDITDRKHAEEVVRQTAAELARSNKDLEQFAYVATHDLQEPLRQVTAFVNLLRDRYGTAFDARGEQYLTYVVEGATRMSALVSGLLDYSRIGRREEPAQSASANEAYAEAVANLRTTIEEAQALVTCDRLATVQADRVQLVQLFQNLIGNAIKFRREGVRPEIHVGCCPDGKTWTFWVRDNGIGIPSELYDRAFVIFQRLHGQGKYPGTGIGLAICKKIVERHGGRIWIESQIGQGSTFFFTMPAAKEAQA